MLSRLRMGCVECPDFRLGVPVSCRVDAKRRLNIYSIIVSPESSLLPTSRKTFVLIESEGVVHLLSLSV